MTARWQAVWSGSQAPALALSLTGPTGANETKALIFGGIWLASRDKRGTAPGTA